ncbi:MAG: hypothetical protein COT26_01185 [Candidatus Kerfeldbacteria bacterium CG08_land_8_20_14_0_20_43_14]|uniref:Uncharacterized protein n=1 Tax=Candidatus Kerfeldbacteria bacterium CG08_land_8_20_14_0_20_43_14 TaxID=2014246 RepID=A0A2H0YQR2_9BACT|nr:MAG: hypothetical protein COT26_01185 [Candidatus Kerfeldbacteria bacterium CG08_land_8_20_14_0_20_43_14]
MESQINLLPEKDKQLKRETKPKAPIIEMTEPKDRVFSERVVRTGGVIEFFKKLFGSKSEIKLKTKPKDQPIVTKVLSPKSNVPVGPVTKIEAMASRVAPAPPPTPAKVQLPKLAEHPNIGFFHRFLNKIEGISAKHPAQPIKQTKPAEPQKNILPTKSLKLSWSAPPSVIPAQKVISPESKPVIPPPPAPPPPVKPAVPLPQIPVVKPVVKKEEKSPEAKSQPSKTSKPEPIFGSGLNVNLVPEEYQPKSGPKARVFIDLSILIPIFVIAALSIGLFLYKNNIQQKISLIDNEYNTISTQIASLTTGTLSYAQVLQQKTSDVNRVLNQHIYWDNFFQRLEKYTLPSVTYSNMTVDVGGSVSLSAVGKSFNDVGNQLLIFKQAQDFVTDVTISSATKSASTTAPSDTPPGQQTAQPAPEIVTFSIALKVKPDIFLKTGK